MNDFLLAKVTLEKKSPRLMHVLDECKRYVERGYLGVSLNL